MSYYWVRSVPGLSRDCIGLCQTLWSSIHEQLLAPNSVYGTTARHEVTCQSLCCTRLSAGSLRRLPAPPRSIPLASEKINFSGNTLIVACEARFHPGKHFYRLGRIERGYGLVDLLDSVNRLRKNDRCRIIVPGSWICGLGSFRIPSTPVLLK